MAMEITSESLAGAQPEPTADYKESPPIPFSDFPGTNKPSSRWRFRVANSTVDAPQFQQSRP